MTPILLSDPDTRVAFLKDAIKCEVTEARNGIYELVLEYPVSGKYFKDIAVEKYIKAKPNIKGKFQLFRIYSVSKPILGTVTVNGEHISYKLSHYPIKTLAPSKTTALAAIDRVLSAANENINGPHKFSADFCNITTVAQFGAELCSARAALGGIRGSVLDCFGGEYEFDNFKVKLHKSRGVNKGVSIRYGKNMTDMKLTLSVENSYTGIFPYFTDNDKTTTLTEGTIHVDNHSGIDERILTMDFTSYFDDGEEKNETTLRAHVLEYLENNDINAVDGSMTVSMIDLSKSAHSGYVTVFETVSLCDTVKVINTLMDVSVTMKVVKTVYDAIGEKYVSLELGTPSSNFADVIKQTQRTADEALKRASQVPDTSALEQKFQDELNDMTKKITGASGGHVVLNPSKNPQELLLLCDSDKLETARKLYRWNSAGLSYSPNGYNGPYTAAFLGDDGKLIINNVTARSISANLIKSDTIMSDSGDLLINLVNSQVVSGAISETKTILSSGHLDLYYGGKHSGRIGQTADNHIAIEGTNPDDGSTKITDLHILDGILYTNSNQRNLFAGLVHCRKAQYAKTAYEFPAFLKVGIGSRASSPTIAMELWPNSTAGTATARIDVFQRMFNATHSEPDSEGNRTLSWNDYCDLDVAFSRLGIDASGNRAMTTRTLRITNEGYEFITGRILVNDIAIITKTNSTTGNCAEYYSLKDKCIGIENNLKSLTTNYNNLVKGYNDLVKKHNQLAKDFASLKNKVNTYHP
jgi:phage minor structural protein